MAVHKIVYQDGAKVMIPVSSSYEYRQLRNTKAQQQHVINARAGVMEEVTRRGETVMVEAKTRLIQFNYSCIPAADGKLRGCTTQSNSVGMDVDFDPKDPDYADKMESAPALILSKKDELGLLMLECSATKGYHVVFRRRPELTQEENLKWASELLGVKYDDKAKDITRVFFTTTASEDDLLFLDDELFINTPIINKVVETPQPTEAAGEKGTMMLPVVAKSVDAAENPLVIVNEPLMYKGFAFEQIISKYWEMFNDGKEPSASDHNRNMLTYELACNLRAICDYNLEMLKKVVPVYDGLTQSEWEETLKSALKQPRKGTPFRLRQVLLALRKETIAKAAGGTLLTPPQRPKRLPAVLKHLTMNTPECYKSAVCDAVFPALAIHLHGVRFRYIDNVEHEPTLMNVLIGCQSVGKGCIKKPIEFILEDIKERDKAGRQREAEYKRKNPSGSNKPKEPRPSDILVQCLIDNCTDAAFSQRVIDANNNGQRYLYAIVDEVEGLKNITSSKSNDDFSLLVRKAFDNAPHGQERVGSDSVAGIAPLRFNFNASTTPPNAQRFFKSWVNDGSLSRLSVSTIIRSDDDDDDPVYGIYDDSYREELKPYLQLLDSAVGLIECPQAIKLARKIKQDNKMYAALADSEAFRVLSYRATVIGYLKAMILFITNGYKWTKDIANYVTWSVQMDLWCKMRYFGEQLERELDLEKKAVQAGPQDLLALLPDEFSKDDYYQVRMQQGRTGKGDSTLRTWQSRGYIEFDEIIGKFHKTESYLSMKQRTQG